MKIDGSSHLSAFNMNLNTNNTIDKEAKLEEVASQFEGIFLDMALKEMRKSEAALKSDLFSSTEEDFYQDMLDQQMALELASGKGIGLKETIIRQLQPAVRGR